MTQTDQLGHRSAPQARSVSRVLLSAGARTLCQGRKLEGPGALWSITRAMAVRALGAETATSLLPSGHGPQVLEMSLDGLRSS
jgi:hypothetical protein